MCLTIERGDLARTRALKRKHRESGRMIELRVQESVEDKYR